MRRSVSVTIATRDDVDTLAALRRRWHPGEPATAGRDDEVFRTWFDTEFDRRVFFVAHRDRAPIGMVNLVVFDRMPAAGHPPGGWGYLSNMFVLDAERNAGVGAALLAALTAHADGLGLERIVLNPSERSMPFYRRNGFDANHRLLVRHRA